MGFCAKGGNERYLSSRRSESLSLSLSLSRSLSLSLSRSRSLSLSLLSRRGDLARSLLSSLMAGDRPMGLRRLDMLRLGDGLLTGLRVLSRLRQVSLCGRISLSRDLSRR